MRSPRTCATHFVKVCVEFRLTWSDLINVDFHHGQIRLLLFVDAFVRIAARLNVKRSRFDCRTVGDCLFVDFEARGVKWSTLVKRHQHEQWKMMHDALRLPHDQKCTERKPCRHRSPNGSKTGSCACL